MRRVDDVKDGSERVQRRLGWRTGVACREPDDERGIRMVNIVVHVIQAVIIAFVSYTTRTTATCSPFIAFGSTWISSLRYPDNRL